MFYQNNNDYMRDAFYYSIPQNSTYANGYNNSFGPMLQNNVVPTNSMPSNNFGNSMMGNNMMMPQQNMQMTSVTSMYPQIYRIINPVASRVISNSNHQYLTEDSLNNMVDTVYNIVEGDVSTLSSSIPTNSGDDTVTQGPARGSQSVANSSNTNSNSTTNSRQTTVTESSRSSTTVMSRNHNSNNDRRDNQLLRDLIKIIIIKELLSRQMGGFAMEGMPNNQMNNPNFMRYSNNSNNFYEPRMYGLI